MIVEAVTDEENKVPRSIRHYSWQLKENGKLPLTIGKKYIVSGIQRTHGYEFYLIIADEDELKANPWWYPSNLFKVLDSTKPDDWVESNGISSFPELAKDKSGEFDNNLQDGDEREKKVFLKYYEKYARAHRLWYVDGKPAP